MNTSLVAHKLVSGANVANEINDICFANNMNDEWEEQLRDDRYGALAWQYLGFSTEGTYSYFPLSNWSDANSCPGTYDPRERAWYLSAISGPLNVMLLLDITSTDSSTNDNLRFTRQKEAARTVLRSLNYWSFFNIGVYTEGASFFGGTAMIRATAANLDRAEEYLDSLVLSDEEYVAFENVLDTSLELLSRAANGAASSLCHSVMIVLATHHNDIASSTNVDDIIDSYQFDTGKMIILPFLFNFQSGVVDPIYEEIACHTAGFHREFTSSASADSVDLVLTLYSSFLAATLENNAVRYSEIYVDALGLGEMTTGAIALYENVTDSYGAVLRTVVGVYGIDVLVSGLNNGGTISNTDIMASLSTLSKCPGLETTDEILLSFREGRTCELALDTTEYGGGGEHGLEENKWKYDLIGAFGLIGSLSFCLIVVAILKNDTNAKMMGGGSIFFLHCTFGIALVAYTLSTAWDDTVRNKYWNDSTMTVLSAVIDPSTCCNTVNCMCLEYSGATCGSLVDSYQEGYCDNGYYCCETFSYECNCQYSDDGGRECDTCSKCVSSVNHRQCEVVCQQCYTGTVVWSYHPEESDTPIILESSTYCNKGSEAASLQCAEDYIDDYSVGSEHAIIYNPLNFLETEEGDNKMPGNYYIVIVAMVACLSISYLILVIMCIMQPKKGAYSTAKAQAAASGHATDPNGIQMPSVVPPPQQYVSHQQVPGQYGQVPQPVNSMYSQQVQQPQYVASAQYVNQTQYANIQQAPPPQQYGYTPSAPSSKYHEEDSPPAPKYHEEDPPPPAY